MSHLMTRVVISITLVMSGCGSHDATDSDRTPTLSLAEVVDLTTDEGVVEARPEIFVHDSMVFVVYLTTSPNRHQVRIYDPQLAMLGGPFEVSTSGPCGTVTDIRGRQDGDFVYLAYECSSAATGRALLFVKRHRLDEAFTEILAPEEPLVDGAAYGSGTIPGEYLNDAAIHVRGDAVYVFTNWMTTDDPIASPTIYRVRQLNASTLETAWQEQLDLSDLLDGFAWLFTMFDMSGRTHSLHAHAKDLGNEHVLRLIAYDDELRPDPDSVVDLVTGRGVLFHPTSALVWQDMLLLTHGSKESCTAGRVEDEQECEIWLRSFYTDLTQAQEIELDELGAHSTLASDGRRVYLAYSSKGKLRVAVFAPDE